MSKIKDETGRRYGRLVVVGLSERTNKRRMAYWVCQCDCGNIKIARGVDLRSGGTKSCGCLREENGKRLGSHKTHAHYDMVGERYGMLTVLWKGGTSTTGTKWVCKCDCGNYVEVRGNSLRNGNTKSCGCMRGRKIG